MTAVTPTTGARQQADPRHVTVGSLEQLDFDPETLSDRSVVTVAEPVRFGEDPYADLRQLGVLREATSRAMCLRWQMIGIPQTSLRTRLHLFPPDRGLGEAAAESAARWRSAYTYGSLYYRVGPGFVTVKDIRPDGEKCRILISGEDADRFLELARGVAPCSADLADALSALEEAGLALSVDGLALVLPFRMKYWPVPHSAI